MGRVRQASRNQIEEGMGEAEKAAASAGRYQEGVEHGESGRPAFEWGRTRAEAERMVKRIRRGVATSEEAEQRAGAKG